MQIEVQMHSQVLAQCQLHVKDCQTYGHGATKLDCVSLKYGTTVELFCWCGYFPGKKKNNWCFHIFRQLAHANTNIKHSRCTIWLCHVQYYSMHHVVHYHLLRLAPKNVLHSSSYYAGCLPAVGAHVVFSWWISWWWRWWRWTISDTALWLL